MVAHQPKLYGDLRLKAIAQNLLVLDRFSQFFKFFQKFNLPIFASFNIFFKIYLIKLYLVSGEPMWSFCNMYNWSVIWQDGCPQTLTPSVHWIVWNKSSAVCFKWYNRWSFSVRSVDPFNEFSWQVIHVWKFLFFGVVSMRIWGLLLEFFKFTSFLPRRKYLVT